MKKITVLVLLLTSYQWLIAQSVGIGTSTPNSSAQLDVTSTTKGMLIPRMLQAERDAIGSPAQGLLIFNTNANSFQYYNGVSWANISHSGIISGTVNKVAKFNSSWGLTAAGLISDNGTGVAINTTNAVADASALLDLTSSSKGLLAPRMTTAQRTAIASPANGLLVFDNSTASFWFYNGATWKEIITTSTSGWGLTGNTGTNPAVNFIGTTDNNDVIFKRNNIRAGNIAITNTAFGLDALNPASTGINNTATGYRGLYFNSSGGANTANGVSALYTNNTGSSNTANGFQALYNNISGNNNTANGVNALYSNVAGSFATAIGNNAMLYSNNSATAFTNNNVAVGFEALRGSFDAAANTGINNTATGYQALRNNTFGSANTAYGSNALYFNTTGGANTAYGTSALELNTTGNSNTAYGTSALVSNTTGVNNTACGRDAFYLNETGSFNTAYGSNALNNSATGSNNTGIGANAQVPSATGSNQVRIGNNNVTYAGIEVAWSITSDKRRKTDIKTTELGLDFIKTLNPVSYYRNNDEKKKTEYGFVAQEVEEALNRAGATNNGIITKDDAGMYSVRYNDFIAPMVKAIQEQQKQIDELKALVNKLMTNDVVK